MFDINARFMRKEPDFEAKPCVVEKVIRLSGAEYDSFARSMLMDQDFIHDNIDSMYHDSSGKLHCLMVVGEGRPDGILVDSSGYDYARYAALVPGAGETLPAMRFPALAELNRKLELLVDHIAEQVSDKVIFDEPANINLEDLEAQFNITLDENMLETVFDMLASIPEIGDVEIDKNGLLVYSLENVDVTAIEEIIVDSTVSKTDMYAYGYSYEGMIPVSKEKALELDEKGYQVYRLYDDDSEGAADSRSDIEDFDGMFGIEDSTWDKGAFNKNIEIFLLNREKEAHGETVGEWLKLPATANDLYGLLERIGIDRPSDRAFDITATRVPYEELQEYVSKYENIDELNMLASYMDGMEDYEYDILKAIITSNVTDIGNGAPALINVLDADNFQAFNLIDAKNAKELGDYWQENIADDDKPDNVSIEAYGREIIAEEKGKFTEWGYISFRHKELSPEYIGVVPSEYRIVDGALHCIRQRNLLRDAKPQSVSERIKAARLAPAEPKQIDQDTQKKQRDNGGPIL